MKAPSSIKRGVLTLLGVSVAMVAAVSGAHAAQASPDYALSISPGSQSVQRGQTASYTLSVTALNGFNSPVSLSTSGGPAGTVLGATTVTPKAGAAAVTTLTVTTTTGTATGSYTVTVTGISGKLKKSASTGLTVNIANNPGFSLATSPASLTLDTGSSGAYNVVLGRAGGFTGTVSLSLCSSLPDGVTSTGFSPAALTGTASSATLTLTIDPGAKAGTASLCIRGTSGSQLASTVGTLVIANSQGKAFTLSSGPIGALSPGVSRPIDLTMTNNDKSSISVTNLTVSLTSTSRSSCPISNFTVGQYTGAYPILLTSGATALSTVPTEISVWPSITMLNTTTNQDGCKGVTLSLSYSGSAQGN